VIDWATGKFGVVQGKRIRDLKWEQLDYFVRKQPVEMPAGWLEAIRREMQMREDTGDEMTAEIDRLEDEKEERDALIEADERAVEAATDRATSLLDYYDPYTGAGA